ncbi:hypothetical protein PMIN06_011464, partial [Paraphaeosphaeria minitans]
VPTPTPHAQPPTNPNPNPNPSTTTTSTTAPATLVAPSPHRTITSRAKRPIPRPNGLQSSLLCNIAQLTSPTADAHPASKHPHPHHQNEPSLPQQILQVSNKLRIGNNSLISHPSRVRSTSYLADRNLAFANDRNDSKVATQMHRQGKGAGCQVQRDLYSVYYSSVLYSRYVYQRGAK